jgi:[ribosomal protein S5]-alanine N-acetyltransferase
MHGDRRAARWPAFAPLATPRLIGGPLTLDHAPAVFAYASDPEICRLVAWPPHEDLDATRRLLAMSMVGYEAGGHYEWALVRRRDQAFVGSVGFGGIDVSRGVADVGYVLARAYWGQGYATEAASAVLQFGFAQLGLRAIEAHAFAEHAASLRVVAKLGFRYHDTRVRPDAASGSSRPISVWRIAREQWTDRG